MLANYPPAKLQYFFLLRLLQCGIFLSGYRSQDISRLIIFISSSWDLISNKEAIFLLQILTTIGF